MRRLVFLGVAALGVAALALAGCGEDAVENSAGSAPNWTEPARYEYTVDSRCGEQLLIGLLTLTVANGEVTAVTGGDEASRTLASSVKAKNFPTLGDLLDEYRRAQSMGADVARVTYDPVDGHPTRIELDPLRNAMDDEACYVISGYSVG